MTKRMGRAFLAAIKKEAEAAPGARESVLGNPQRRRVFQSLCLHPAGSIAEVARALGVSPATVRFHALRLAAAAYLAATDESFVPAGLVPPDDLPLFRALATAPARRALAAAYGTAGLSVGELADAVGMSRQALASLLDSLVALGLISRVADGRFTRVYATRALEERRERHTPRARQFCESVLRRLAAEGEAPAVLRQTPAEFQCRFGRGSLRALLELRVEPYSALLM